MTSTYDHRVIQGAESGAFLRRIDQLLQGEDGFYEGVFEALGRDPRAPRRRPTPAPVTAAEPVPAAATPAAAARSPTRRCSRRCRPPPRWSRPTACTATSPRGSTRSAPSRWATRRSSPPPSNLNDELMRRIPASVLRVAVPGETFADALPAPARDLQRHDRLRDRAHLRPRAARLAAPGDRVGQLPPAARAGRAAAAARAPVRGRGARELPAQGVPGQEAVLDRGPRRRSCRCSTRRSSWPPARARARSCSAWPTAAG